MGKKREKRGKGMMRGKKKKEQKGREKNGERKLKEVENYAEKGGNGEGGREGRKECRVR